jgi:alcohol dehydrogenase class IV
VPTTYAGSEATDVWGLTEGRHKTTGTEPLGLAGRERVLYAAYLAAVAFASAGSGLHHKICHVLGGMFGLPHTRTHAVVLPLDAPKELREYGFTEADIPAAVEAILPAAPPGNPAPVTGTGLAALLRAAWQGRTAPA